MPLSEKKKASNARWDKANLVRMSLAVPVALHEQMKEYTEQHGESMNGFIRRAIEKLLEDEKDLAASV